MRDTYRHKGERRHLIDVLRQKGIRDNAVLEVMGQLPRHLFLPSEFEEKAYQDKAWPIGNEQTISQPYTVAFQTELLQVEPRQKVLEVGTGSGYQAAVLAMLKARVFTLERQQLLYERTSRFLQQIGLPQIRCYYKDGYKGLAELAPFDRILVTAGAPEVPAKLLRQLKVGGIMVIPVGDKYQEMYRITRVSEDEYIQENHGTFRFVPFLKGKNDEK